MATMQNVCDLARVPLNDAAKVRYSDADLLKYANAFVKLAYERRPDLRSLGSWLTPYADLALVGTFPLDERFAQTAADYIGGRAEMKDDENVNSARAQGLIKMALAELTS